MTPGQFTRRFIAGPGFDTRTTVEGPTSLVDLAPTLLEAAGLEIPDEMHGRSLLPIVQNSEVRNEATAFIQISESEIGRAIRTDRWKYGVAAPTMHGWRGGRGEQSSEEYVERYLYDLHRDPAEQVNLVGRSEYGSVADQLRNQLLEYIHAVEGESPDIFRFEDPGYTIV